MPIDLAAIPATTKAEYIDVGKRYGSEDTLAQADATLAALATHGAALVTDGFATKDTARLTEARDALLAAGVVRTVASAGASTQRKARGGAVRAAKARRESARSVLLGALSEIAESGPDTAANAVKTALEKTATSGASTTVLVEQLTLIEDTLSGPEVAPAAADRGGPEAVAALGTAIDAVKTITAPAKQGTPEQTERLNIFDGIIVHLARRARRAARAASRRLGSPALANAFALTHLDGQASAGAPDASPPVAPPAPPKA